MTEKIHMDEDWSHIDSPDWIPIAFKFEDIDWTKLHRKHAYYYGVSSEMSS